MNMYMSFFRILAPGDRYYGADCSIKPLLLDENYQSLNPIGNLIYDIRNHTIGNCIIVQASLDKTFYMLNVSSFIKLKFALHSADIE